MSLEENISDAERNFLDAAERLSILLIQKGGPHNWAGRPALAALATLNGGAIAITEEAFKIISGLRQRWREHLTGDGVSPSISGQAAKGYRILMTCKLQEVEK